MAMRPWRNVPVPRWSVRIAAGLRRLVWIRRLPGGPGPGGTDPHLGRLEGLRQGGHRVPVASRGFWVGPRPPLIPLVIKVFGSSTGYLTAQAVVAALAWGALAWTVGRLVSAGMDGGSSPPGSSWPSPPPCPSPCGIAPCCPSPCPSACWRWSPPGSSGPRAPRPGPGSPAPRWPAWASPPPATPRSGRWPSWAWPLAVFALLRLAPEPRPAPCGPRVLAACLLAVVGVTEWGTLASHRTTQNVADVFYVRVFPYPGPGGLVRRPWDARTTGDRRPGPEYPGPGPGGAGGVLPG